MKVRPMYEITGVAAHFGCYILDHENLVQDYVEQTKEGKNYLVQEFKKLGLGSFYGVAMGATEPAKFIIAEYSGGKKTEKPFGLIGKGLTFDSGGISRQDRFHVIQVELDLLREITQGLSMFASPLNFYNSRRYLLDFGEM